MDDKLIPVGAVADVAQLGEVFHRSGYFRDVRDASQAIVKILAGRELGFPPMASMMGIHIIEGKPALSSNLMAALIKRSGKYNYRVQESSATRCALEFIENGESVGVSEFTQADATRAGVWGRNTWAKYPKAMLFSRALSQGLRTFCPDLTMAPAYGPEELGAEVNEDGDVTALKSEPPKAAPKTYSRPAPAAIEPQPPESPAAPAAPASVGVASVQAAPTGAVPEEGKGPSGAAADIGPYIGPGQQANFAREFRAALPDALQQDAETLRHQWLKEKGYIDDTGKPTSKMIPHASFKLALADAKIWAAKAVPPTEDAWK